MVRRQQTCSLKGAQAESHPQQQQPSIHCTVFQNSGAKLFSFWYRPRQLGELGFWDTTDALIIPVLSSGSPFRTWTSCSTQECFQLSLLLSSHVHSTHFPRVIVAGCSGIKVTFLYVQVHTTLFCNPKLEKGTFTNSISHPAQVI